MMDPMLVVPIWCFWARGADSRSKMLLTNNADATWSSLIGDCLRIAFLREERVRAGSSTLSVKNWLRRASQPSSVLTIEQAEQSVRESLGHLHGKNQSRRRGQIGGRWLHGRWHWRIELECSICSFFELNLGTSKQMSMPNTMKDRRISGAVWRNGFCNADQLHVPRKLALGVLHVKNIGLPGMMRFSQ